jgi:trans-aconitate 2-methyltransferase
VSTRTDTDWQPDRYEDFATQRQRAARDLVAAIPDFAVHHICDLGCGSGLSTALLRQRWPAAAIVAVDRSPAMLRRARERLPDVTFLEADIASFRPRPAPDLLFANASLHWVAEHLAMLPRLLEQLAPGGVLAVQMPNNSGEPSHRLMEDVAGRPPYAAYPPAADATRVALASAGEYYDRLAASASVTIWETRYYHRLENAAAIADWFGSTALQPWIDALPEELRGAYLDDYRAALHEAYPSRTDGSVLLAMPRLFIVARRGQ